MTRSGPLLLSLFLAACPAEFHFHEDDGGPEVCPAAGCSAGLVCSSSLGCVECRTASDCSGAFPRCLAAQGRCVECVLDADCAAGHICEQVTHHCQQRCNEDDECASDICDPIGGIEVCVWCVQPGQCSAAAGPRCDRDRGACARCVTDTDCGGAAPRCDRFTGTCRECRGSADCGGASCGRDGLCVR